MYRRNGCWRLRRKGLQAEAPEINVLVHLFRPSQYVPRRVSICSSQTTRRCSHDGLEHVHGIEDVWRRSRSRPSARPAIGHACGRGQTCRGCTGRYQRRQGRRARCQTGPHRLGRSWIAPSRGRRVRVATRGRGARGRRVRREPVQSPHVDVGVGL